MAQHNNATPGITLVTGATGFIGRHCVKALSASGARLRLMCRNAEKARQLFGPDVELATGDLLEPATLTNACAGVHTIYNLAGSYEFGPAHRAVMWHTNVDGTENLLSAAWQARVERVVHCSTAGILAGKGEWISADDFPERPPAFCHYKRSKWHGEVRALAWAKRRLPVVIASPTAPVGAGDERPTPTGRMFLELLRGRFPACTRTGLNIIHVNDLADGLIAVGQRGQVGQRYILGGENVWLGELMTLAAEAGRCVAPRFVVPWVAVAFGGVLGEIWGQLGGKRGRLCWETAYFARQKQFFDLQPTLSELGWRATRTVPQAVTEAVHHFAESMSKATAGRVISGCAPLPP